MIKILFLFILSSSIYGALSWETLESVYNFSSSYPLNIVIQDNDKWTRSEVIERIRRTEDIYSQCDVSFSPINLVINHKPEWASIDFTEKEDLDLVLKYDLNLRPLIFFMNKNTATFSFPAFAWTDNSKVEDERKRVGYVFHDWKRVEKIDLALFAKITNYEVLAHELGHILLNTGPHLDEPGNVMGKKSAPMGDKFNKDQCDKLKERAIFF